MMLQHCKLKYYFLLPKNLMPLYRAIRKVLLPAIQIRTSATDEESDWKIIYTHLITAPCSQTIVGRIWPNCLHLAYIGGDCLLWTMSTWHNWKALNIMGVEIPNFRLNLLKCGSLTTMSMFPYHTWFVFDTPPTVQFWMQIKNTQHKKYDEHLWNNIQ